MCRLETSGIGLVGLVWVRLKCRAFEVWSNFSIHNIIIHDFRMDHIPVYKIVGVLPKILFIDIITRGFIWTISFSPVQSRATRTFIWGSGDLKDCNFQNSI